MKASTLNSDYVMAPFRELFTNSQNTILLGLRIIEKIEIFPEPTAEELVLFQFTFNEEISDISQSKKLFKKWILLNGFEDIHKCLRMALERLLIYRTIEEKSKTAEIPNLQEFEKEQLNKVRTLNFPTLIENINALFKEPLKYRNHIDSLNYARNCLVHSNGIVSKKQCNNPEKTKLTISGNRFKIFFKRGDEETIAEIGKPGPENASLSFGAEEFEITFEKDTEITIDLKQFLDILNTCVFIQADIDIKLKKNCA